MSLTDKRTIGLTSENRLVVEQLMKEYYFKEQTQVAKFGLSIAIKNDIPIGTIEGADTIWNVGSFDSDGEIKALTLALYPGVETPYRVVEYLFNKGIEIIGVQMKEQKDFNIVDYL